MPSNLRLSLSTFACVALAPHFLNAGAQDCSTIYDLNTAGEPAQSIAFDSGNSPNASSVLGSAELVKSGAIWYFRASSSVAGLELWRTDGTSQGTFLVGDTEPGPVSESPYHLTDLNGDLLFFSTGAQLLWKVDSGSNKATFVTALSPGAGFEYVAKPLAFGSQMLFVSDTQAAGYELWATDGTSAGTFLLKDTNPGPGHGYPHAFALNAAGDKALFLAGGDSTNYGLWETDGTSAGTQQIYDFDAPGLNGHVDDADSMAMFGGKLYFEGRSSAFGSELWSTDGTSAGTQLVRDMTFGVAGTQLKLSESVELGGRLHFVAKTNVTGSEIWQTDGTPLGTWPIIQPNPGSADSNPTSLIEFGGSLMFVAQRTTGIGPTGYELWRYQVGSLGLYHEAIPGPTSGFDVDATQLFASQGKLFFSASTLTSGSELYFTDAAFNGVQPLHEIEPGSEASSPTHFTRMSPSTFMFVTDQPNAKRSLWTSNGTYFGTELMHDFAPIHFTESSTPRGIINMNGLSALLLARVEGADRLHRYDSQSGASIVSTDFSNMPAVSGSLKKAWAGDRLQVFFHGTSPNQGAGMWASDGTEAGTVLLQNLAPLADGGGHGNNNKFLFQGTLSPLAPGQLFITDGTPVGTHSIGNVEPRLGSAMASIGGHTYFARRASHQKDELWVTDGTASGTHLVQDFSGQVNDFKVTSLTTLGNQIAFVAEGQASSFGLWRSDGTPAGTIKVSDRVPDQWDPTLPAFFAWKNMLLFSANDAQNGRELWRTNLAPGGTQLVLDIRPGVGHSSPTAFVEGAGAVLFLADEYPDGINVWRSDGTAAGTVQFAAVDVAPIFGNTLVPAGSGAYLAAAPGVQEPSLFFVDGVSAPAKLCIKNESSAALWPHQLAWVDGQLLFAYHDSSLGLELHSIPAPHAMALDLGISGSGVRLSASAPSLGNNMTIACEAPPIGRWGAIAISPPQPDPQVNLVQSGNANWLDFNNIHLVAGFVSPGFTASFPIPATPSLAGVQVNMQAWFFGTGLFPATTSNGVALRLGS